MWVYPVEYDVIVVGAGHAGIEAALAAARMGARTLMLTMSLDTIGKMSCNPAVGGVAKGHMVREIDALGGEMGKCIDKTGIHFRMLNATRGPAVWAPRAQADKVAYQFDMKRRCEAQINLETKEGTTEALWVEEGKIVGIDTKEGIRYRAKAVVLSAGTFMRGLIHIGETHFSGGRAGDKPSTGLSASLEAHGLTLGRFKTGTPPRIHGRSIDFSKCEEQKPEHGIRFAFEPETNVTRPEPISCWITYTTEETKKIVEANIHRSPMYSGTITGIGPRYCPSIEDKIKRFNDKERHQIFLEREGLSTDEYYVNGISSSLPFDVQLDLIHSVIGLEKAEIMRSAYAIEYDVVTAGQIGYNLETKAISGLFLAGQINGTSGYEEAAGQGLMAGINAVLKIRGEEPFVMKRSESYIGVMIDDLVSQVYTEPYRMFTSRAEHRLLLRQDNADLRLTRYGAKLGLISKERLGRTEAKAALIETEVARLQKVYKTIDGKGYTLAQLLARPETTYAQALELYPEVRDCGEECNQQIELTIKYSGYISRQEGEIRRLEGIEDTRIPGDFDFRTVCGLRNEAREKLSRVSPQTLGQASRIAGVSPADLSILMIAIKKGEQ